MWQKIASFILRNRGILIIVLLVAVLIMAFFARNVKMSYELVQMLPNKDTTFQIYQNFKKEFGEDGNVMIVGFTDSNFFNYQKICDWYNLNNKIKQLSGVEEVVSPIRILNVHKEDSIKRFVYKKVLEKEPKSQEQVDSLKKVLASLKFYDGLIYNIDKNFYTLAITLDKHRLTDKNRVFLIDSIVNYVNEYSIKYQLTPHISGMPYIRVATTEKIKSELYFFLILSIIVSVFVLLGLFRSIRAVIGSMIVVGLSVIFTLGFMGLMNYKITILTGILPSLLIIIGIENCIFLFNRYFIEYRSHQNKVKALSRIIQRIGVATFLTNLTTAIGFGTFIFSSSNILKEFGIVASANIMIEFLLSLIVIPIFLSFLPVPKERHTKHLESKYFNFILQSIENVIVRHKKIVVVSFILLVIAGTIGMTFIHTSGKMVDDLKENDPILADLKYFEQNVGGVMPFEIVIDTRQKNGIMKLSTIKKIDTLQNFINDNFKYFSKPISVVELVKFAKQAYYNGNPSKYTIPGNTEASFILSYLPKKNEIDSNIQKRNPLHAFLDSSKSKTRVSYQMADVGLKEMKAIEEKLYAQINSLFPNDKYNVIITGNSVVYTKGTDFLIKNLIQSVLIAIVLISLIMGTMFRSYRMVIISIIPNLIPLILLAGIMGYFNIPLKPSTIIVFSIALGIAVDNAIHFLSRYRFELRNNNYNAKDAVIKALYGNGISMLSSLLVLVLGFSIFIFSDFGGTQAMGILITLTLIFSLFCNIVLLPLLIYNFSKRFSNKEENEPLVEFLDDSVIEDN